MVLLAVEMVLGEEAVYSDKALIIGGLVVPVSISGLAQCNYFETDDPPIFSFDDLFEKRIRREEIEAKVVILWATRGLIPLKYRRTQTMGAE